MRGKGKWIVEAKRCSLREDKFVIWLVDFVQMLNACNLLEYIIRISDSSTQYCVHERSGEKGIEKRDDFFSGETKHFNVYNSF